MKITFLGTGTSQGVPIIGCKCGVCTSSNPKDKRLRTSIMVEIDGLNLVVDTGPDFRYQMLRQDVCHLDGVLFTHSHKDHIAGLDDIRAFNYLQKCDMEIYATEDVQAALKREFEYIFAEIKYPGIPQVNLNTIGNYPFKIQETTIIPIEVMHYKLPVLGFRFGDFTYITDANYISSVEKEKIKGSKILVLNALRKEAHISHFTLQEAIDLVQELQPEQAYFTHISHQLGQHNEVSAALPKNIFLAYDGLELVL